MTWPHAHRIAPETTQDQSGIDERESDGQVVAHQAAHETRGSKHVEQTKDVLFSRMCGLREDEHQKRPAASRTHLRRGVYSGVNNHRSPFGVRLGGEFDGSFAEVSETRLDRSTSCMCASTHVHTLQTDCPRLGPRREPHERFFLRRRDRRFHTASRHGFPMGSIELAGAFLPRDTN